MRTINHPNLALCPICFPNYVERLRTSASAPRSSDLADQVWIHRDGIYGMDSCLHEQFKSEDDDTGSHGPLRSDHGPLRGEHGFLRSGHGPLRSGSGLIKDSRKGAGHRSLGYLPDPYDDRDHHVDVSVENLVKPIRRRLYGGRSNGKKKGSSRLVAINAFEKRASEFSSIWDRESVQDAHDLVEEGHFSPVEDQRELGSCTAHAVGGLIEYLHRKESNESLDLSRMFLYYNSRRLDGLYGDTGSYIRSTIKATTALGAVPEHHWPYESHRLDVVPDSFCYALASNYRALSYVRLDGKTASERGSDIDHRRRVNELIRRIQQSVIGGYPVAVGFLTPPNISNSPLFPIPHPRWTPDDVGHAVLIVGYDNTMDCGPGARRGAFKIRNIWGAQWGNDGYGYLPYEYFERGLVRDCWTILYWEALVNDVFD